jgi:hypothetical protein
MVVARSFAHSVTLQGTGEYTWTVAIVAIEPDYRYLQIEALPRSLRMLP